MPERSLSAIKQQARFQALRPSAMAGTTSMALGSQLAAPAGHSVEFGIALSVSVARVARKAGLGTTTLTMLLWSGVSQQGMPRELSEINTKVEPNGQRNLVGQGYWKHHDRFMENWVAFVGPRPQRGCSDPRLQP